MRPTLSEVGIGPLWGAAVVLGLGGLLGILIVLSWSLGLGLIGLLVLAVVGASAQERHLVPLLRSLLVSLPFIAVAVNLFRYGIQVSFVLAGLVILVVSLRRCLGAERHPTGPREPVSLFLLVFAIVALLSVVMTLDLPPVEVQGELAWLRSLKQLASLGMAASLYLAVRIGCRSPEAVRSCIATHLVVGTAVALFGHYEWGSNYFQLDLPLDRFYGNNLSIINEPALQRERFDSVFGLPRVASVLVEPGFFGSYLVTVLPFFVAGAMHRQYFFTQSRTLFYLAGGTVGVAILLTLSRSPYMGITASLLILSMLALRARFWRILTRVLVLLLVAGGVIGLLRAMAPPEIWEEMGRRFIFMMIGLVDYDDSLVKRSSSLIASWEMLKAYPLLGVGFGNFGFYYDRFDSSGAEEILKRLGTWVYEERQIRFQFPLSVYGQVIAETGVLGALAFCGMILAGIRCGLRTYCEARRPVRRAMALGSVSALAGFLISMTATSGFHTIPFLWPILGLVVAQSHLRSGDGLERRANPWGPVRRYRRT